MNGVINIYKDKGYSSFHVVYALRKMTGEQKVGHTGTLDPDVSGVLPVCIGKATKLVGQLTDSDKIYRCRMLFGKRTDTQDLSGKVLEEMTGEQVLEILGANTPDDAEKIKQNIIQTIRSFEGEIEQIPPMYSALKVNGAKLVNLARKGVEVERKARKVTIHSITDIEISRDLLHVQFTVHCSRGTYVRTLCEDIGGKLQLPACMEELERTYAAGLGLETAITLEQAAIYEKEGTLEDHMIPTDHFLMEHPSLTVTDEAVRRLIYGNYLMPEDIETKETGEKENPSDPQAKAYRIYDRKGTFYALYRYDAKDRCYKCIKMFL